MKGQGYIFTGICHSVYWGGVWDTTPRDQTPSWDQTPPGPDYPLGPDPPPQFFFSNFFFFKISLIQIFLIQIFFKFKFFLFQLILVEKFIRPPPSGLCRDITPSPPRDGQCAGGTHPTGMHSCFLLFRNRFCSVCTTLTCHLPSF